MATPRPHVRPAVLLSVVGVLVVAFRLQMWWLETTTSYRGLAPHTVGEWGLLVGTFLLAGALAFTAAVVARRRVSRIYALLLAAAIGGLGTAHYNSPTGVALGAAIGLLVVSHIVRRAVLAFAKVCGAVLAGVVGGATLLIFTGNPGDGWHGPMAYGMVALACIAGSLLLWRAWRGGAPRRQSWITGHCALLLALVVGQWLSLSVDTLRRVWWAGTYPWGTNLGWYTYKRDLCLIPCDERWLYRGFIGVRGLSGGPRVNDRQLATIGGWQELEWLQLDGSAITDEGMIHVGRLNRLGAVSIQGAPIGDDSLNVLGSLLGLRHVDLRGTRVTDQGLARLQTLSLWGLYIDGTQITDDGLESLRGLWGLQNLGLSGTRVRGDGLGHLSALPQLRQLNLANTAVTDDGLALLGLSETPRAPGRLPLASLDLSGTRVTDRGVQHLAGLGSLKVARTQITDEALRRLAHLDHLVALDLSDTQVTDAGLVHLKPLRRLNQLELAGTRVTATGLLQLVDSVALRYLDLRRSGVRDDDLPGLRRSFPDVRFVTDGAPQ